MAAATAVGACCTLPPWLASCRHAGTNSVPQQASGATDCLPALGWQLSCTVCIAALHGVPLSQCWGLRDMAWLCKPMAAKRSTLPAWCLHAVMPFRLSFVQYTKGF